MTEFITDENLLNPSERLIIALMNSQLVWEKGNSEFNTIHCGLRVCLRENHFVKRKGGLFSGESTEDRFEYQLEVATKPGEAAFRGIQINSVSDPDRHDDLQHLYHLVTTTFNSRGIESILNTLEGK